MTCWTTTPLIAFHDVSPGRARANRDPEQGPVQEPAMSTFQSIIETNQMDMYGDSRSTRLITADVSRLYMILADLVYRLQLLHRKAEKNNRRTSENGKWKKN